MNYLKTGIIAAFLSMICLPGLHAQNIDNNRMNRDIHIMDNVLRELFKTQWSAHGNSGRMSSGTLSFGSNNDINGTYLPDYGVIFTIPAHSSSFLIVHNNDDNESTGYTFQYGDEGSKKITKEGIISRIKDFLRSYGSTIGQLKNRDRITVIYKADNPGDVRAVYAFSGKRSNKKAQEQRLPSTITVTAGKANLAAFRKGSISKEQFDKRLDISTLDDNSAAHQDIKIMANILKTTFEDTDDDAFKVRGSVNHIYIDGLGALFYLDTSYGGGFYNLAKGIKVIGKRLSNIFKADSSGHGTVTFSSSSDHSSKAEKQSKQEQEQAYQNFLTQLKQTIVDYGRTLKSVKNDEQVYVSVALSVFGDDIPNRVDLQIKKSVLEGLDKGRINREQAMQQITVRENGS